MDTLGFETEAAKGVEGASSYTRGGVAASYEAFPELFRERVRLGSIWQSGPYIHAWKTSPPMP
jgi:hypothetical protein